MPAEPPKPAETPTEMPRGSFVFMNVTPPEDAKDGDILQVSAPDGTLRQFVCPKGVVPGTEVTVPEFQLPPILTVNVPEGVEPGQPLEFMAKDGRKRIVEVPEQFDKETRTFTCLDRQHVPILQLVVPEGMTAGQTMTFVGPNGRVQAAPVPEGAEAGQVFMVSDVVSLPILETQIPEDKKPGETFEIAGGPGGVPIPAVVPEGAVLGQRYTAMCYEMQRPEGKEEGDKLQYQSMGGDIKETPIPANVDVGQLFLTVELSPVLYS